MYKVLRSVFILFFLLGNQATFGVIGKETLARMSERDIKKHLKFAQRTVKATGSSVAIANLKQLEDAARARGLFDRPDRPDVGGRWVFVLDGQGVTKWKQVSDSPSIPLDLQGESEENLVLDVSGGGKGVWIKAEEGKILVPGEGAVEPKEKPVDKKPEKKPEPPKPKSLPERFLPILTDAQLQALTEQEKELSDTLFIQQINYIIEEVFFAPDKRSVGKGLYSKKDITDMEQAYLYFIQETFVDGDARSKRSVAGLAKEESFKKRGKLLAFLQELPTVVATHKANLFVNFDAVVDSIGALVKVCVFDAALITNDALETLIANIGVTQKNVRNPTRLDEIDSDKAVKKILKEWMRLVREDKRYEVGEEQLTQDYIEKLRVLVNRLRAHPDFMRVERIYGVVAQAKADMVNDPIAKLRAVPLLYLLKTKDESNFKQPRFFYSIIAEQLFFDVEEMGKAFESKHEDPAFQAVLTDKISRLLKEKASVDTHQFLQEQFASIKKVKDILNTISKLRAAIGRKKELESIEKQLKTFDPDLDVIIADFKTLTERDELAFEPQLKSVVNKYRTEKVKSVIVVEVLQAAKEEFKRTKQHVGKFLVDLLETKFKERNQSVSFSMKRSLKGIQRKADTIRSLLGTMVGGQNVLTKYVTREELRKWIEPYGLLMTVLYKYPMEAKGLDPTERPGMLRESLEAMDDGRVKAEANYVGVIKEEASTINAGVYKGKLKGMLAALADFDLEKFFELVESFVEKAGFITFVKAETGTPNYNGIVADAKAFLVNSLLQEIINTIKALNNATGERVIEGIPQKKTSVYRAMKNIFNELIELLEPDGAVADLTILEKENITQAFDAVRNKFRIDTKVAIKDRAQDLYSDKFKVFLKEIEAFLGKMQEQILMLKEVAQPTTADSTDSGTWTGGGPPPAPTDGPPPPGGGAPPLPFGGPPLPGGSGPPAPKVGPPVPKPEDKKARSALFGDIEKLRKD